MAQHYRFFGSADGDPREYIQTQFAEVLERILRNGYFKGVGTELQVVASTPNAMSVDVGIGQAWINGYWYGNDAVVTLPIATANTVNPRIDRIVLRLDVVTNRTIELAVLQGTPAVSPVAPSLTRDGQIHEIALADVLVGANVSSILTANITDKRNDDTLCGFAVGRDTVESGNHANGRWVKYPDGTMIATMPVRALPTRITVFTADDATQSQWDFPLPFISAPIVTATIDGGNSKEALISSLSTVDTTTTKVVVRAHNQTASFDPSTNVFAKAIAIGRWK